LKGLTLSTLEGLFLNVQYCLKSILDLIVAIKASAHGTRVLGIYIWFERLKIDLGYYRVGFKGRKLYWNFIGEIYIVFMHGKTR
jgi:hypothetical protein